MTLNQVPTFGSGRNLKEDFIMLTRLKKISASLVLLIATAGSGFAEQEMPQNLLGDIAVLSTSLAPQVIPAVYSPSENRGGAGPLSQFLRLAQAQDPTMCESTCRENFMGTCIMRMARVLNDMGRPPNADAQASMVTICATQMEFYCVANCQ